MILPTKHISQERALLTVGARILSNLEQPKTVSAMWEELSVSPRTASEYSTLKLRYDQFVLALDLLYLIGAVRIGNGLLVRSTP